MAPCGGGCLTHDLCCRLLTSFSVLAAHPLQADRLDAAKHGYRANDLRKCLQDIVFAYTYPRLDAEVTKKMNHLLKVCECVSLWVVLFRCGCVCRGVSVGWSSKRLGRCHTCSCS